MARASLLLGLLGLVPTLHEDPATEAAADPPRASPPRTSEAPGAQGCIECHSSAYEGPRRGGCTRPALMLPDPERKGFEWEALVRAGVRFLDVNGSRNRFDTDLNLDNGARLQDFELTGRFLTANPYLSRFQIDARSIGDPYQRLRGVFEKDGLYRGSAGYTEARYKYRAAGDYHRVDHKVQDATYDLELPILETLTVFASFSRLSDDGFWLTNRIGNRNLTPLTSINGVDSPRRLDAENVEVGITGDIDGTAVTLAFDYLSQDEDNRWVYSQPATANPIFTESEDFSSDTSLRGPGGRLSLAQSFDGVDLAANVRVTDLDRRVSGNGVVTGYDTDEFTTTTSSFSTGNATTWIVDGTAVFELSDTLVLNGDFRYVDYEENMRIAQTDFTVYPNTGTTLSVNTRLDQHTTQRVWDLSFAFDWQALDSLQLTAGYGWSQEDLKVPELEVGDDDFLKGLIKTEGAQAGFDWRPDEHWTVRVFGRDFGNSGMQLTPLTEDQKRMIHTRVRYKRAGFWAESSYKYERAKNHVSDHRDEINTATFTTGVDPHDDLSLHLSYVYSDYDNRTLTNFYFDPDPNPVPSIVGYEGESSTYYVGATLKPSAGVTWRADASYTTVDGDFDVDMLDWRVDLSVRVLRRGYLGVEVRQVDYEESGGTDNYGAFMTFVYWRQELGG
ncbi:MAG: TonB-dependent receptor [Planctomycetota bacterium]